LGACNNTIIVGVGMQQHEDEGAYVQGMDHNDFSDIIALVSTFSHM
jgi:hypothetical protein